MKKLLCLILACALICALLAGCGAQKTEVNVDFSGQDLTEETTAASEEPEEEAPTEPEKTPEPTREYAETVTEGVYTVDTYSDGTCEIVSYSGNAPDLEIPGELAGCGVVAIGDSAFENHRELKSVILPEGLQSIGGFAFKNCTALGSINFPEGLTAIGHCSFNGCKLSDIVIPDSVSFIGAWAFNGNPWQNALLKAADTEWVELGNNAGHLYNGAEETVTIPAGFNGYDFMGNTKVKNIIFSDGITEIPSYSCEAMTSLKVVTFPDSLLTVGEAAFRSDSGLTELVFANGLISIESLAFKNCSGLATVTLPDSCTDIAEDAFGGCSKVTFVQEAETNAQKEEASSEMAENGSADISFEGKTYHLTYEGAEITDGKLVISVGGYGSTMAMRNGAIVIVARARAVVDGETMNATTVTANATGIYTFEFDTDQMPETILIAPYEDQNNPVTLWTAEDKAEAAEEASPETADSAETGGKIYTWGDFSFKLAELTFGLGDFESTFPDFFTPSGKWARADFTITDGRMSTDDLYELVQQKEGIMLGEYVAIVVITKSAVTEGNLSYTSTSFSVVFDVPEGYVLDEANLIINESVTTAD